MDKHEEEKIVKDWLKQILGKDIGAGSLHELLKDGIVLCQAINKINKVQSAPFPRPQRVSFVQMENIYYFIENARRLGVTDEENFQTVDLFEGKNMKQVIHCLYSLSRNLHKRGITDFPVIGPKLVEPMKITFSESQLADAKRAVSLQYGYTKGGMHAYQHHE